MGIFLPMAKASGLLGLCRVPSGGGSPSSVLLGAKWDAGRPPPHTAPFSAPVVFAASQGLGPVLRV